MRRISFVLLLLAVVAAGPALAAGYRTSVGTGADAIPVIVVSGTPYEMGYSYGSLMAAEVSACASRFVAYAQAYDPVRYSDPNLDAAWAAVEPYIHSRFIEEMHGLADGSGAPYELLRRMHSVPLVEDYACSGVAVWGAASANGHLYQIRNLDWVMDAGLQDYPVIVVYVPETGVAHANVACAGWVGSNAGLNARGIALTEKGASPDSDYPYNLNGVPFWAMFRDILQDASTLDDALSIITNAQRIKKYYYVVGDGDARAGVKIRAFAPDLDVWTDNDPADEIYPNVLPNVVYKTMDDAAAWSHLNTYYGQYDAERMIELSQLVHGGGNLMDVVYDATARQMWVAYAEGAQFAYQREYVHFDLNDYVFQDDFEDAAFTEYNWWKMEPKVTRVPVEGNSVLEVRSGRDATNRGSNGIAGPNGGKSFYVDGLTIGADIRVLSQWGGIGWGYQGCKPGGAMLRCYHFFLRPQEDVVGIVEKSAAGEIIMAYAIVPGLEFNAWYRVQMVSTSTNFELWLAPKGEALTKVIDVPQDVLHPGEQLYAAGAVGVYSCGGDPDSLLQFDNFSIDGVPDPVKHLACPIVRALREQPAVVPVWLNDGEGVTAFQFDLYYDPTMLTDLTAPGVVKGSLIADDPDWLLFSNLTEAGHLRVVAYNQASEPLEAGCHGEIVQVWFTINPATAASAVSLLDLEGIVLSDHEGVAMPSAAWDGAVRVARAAEWFEFDPIASPQCGDPLNPLPFTVTIRAFDEYSDPGTLYNGTANLTDLTGTLLPLSAAFTNGVFTGDVTIGQPIASDQITATDAADSAVTGTSNAFQVIGEGDPTGDGETNVLDVLRTVNFALELMAPSDAEFAAADANHDGAVNVLDVIIIQNMALGITGTSAGGASALQATRMQAAAAGGEELSMQATAANGISMRAAGGKPAPGVKKIAVPVLIDNASGVAGFSFDLAYDSNVLTPVEVRGGALLAGKSDWVVAGNLSGNPARALGYSNQARALSGASGVLTEVVFAQKGKLNQSTLRLSNVVASDSGGRALARNLRLGKVYNMK